MKKTLLIPFMLLGFADACYGQTPNASAIQFALNQGIELESSHFQDVAEVVILQGGGTADNDFLFICTGRLMWKLSSEEFQGVLQ